MAAAPHRYRRSRAPFAALLLTVFVLVTGAVPAHDVAHHAGEDHPQCALCLAPSAGADAVDVGNNLATFPHLTVVPTQGDCAAGFVTPSRQPAARAPPTIPPLSS